MKVWPVLLLTAVVMFASPLTFAQNVPATGSRVDPPSQQTIEKIADELGRVSKSLDTFNLRLDNFLQSLNKYKGVQLSEQQQRLLFGYEVLNQTEQLAATLRRSLLETADREATLRRRLQQITFDMRPENLDRFVQGIGTTKTDEARENQRRKLEVERDTLQNALREVESGRDQITENLRAAEAFAQSFRRSLFAQLRNELGNSNY